MISFKNKMSKVHVILMIGTLIFTMGILIFLIVQRQEWADLQNKKIIDNQKIRIAIRDNYNGIGKNPSIMEFIEEKNSLQKLQNVYEELNNNSKFSYMEIVEQSLEYKGYGSFDYRFINGNRQELANQMINGEYYTPLKSLQISNKIYNSNNLNGQLESGKGFVTEDYEMQDSMKIQVILGNGYNTLFSIGDVFHVKYLGYGDLTCQVKGFFKPGTVIAHDNRTVCLDDYILAPAVNYIETTGKNAKFQKILYSIKTTCAIEGDIADLDQYHEIIKELKNCFKRANIDYRYESRIIELSNRLHIGKNIAAVIGGLGIIAGCIFLFVYSKNVSLAEGEKRSEIENFSFTLHLLFAIVVNAFLCIILQMLVLFAAHFEDQYREAVQIIVIYNLVAFITVLLRQKIQLLNNKKQF